jgi:hypothetical protein
MTDGSEKQIILTPEMIEAGTAALNGFPEPTLKDDVRAIITAALRVGGFTVIEDPEPFLS